MPEPSRSSHKRRIPAHRHLHSLLERAQAGTGLVTGMDRGARRQHADLLSIDSYHQLRARALASR